jgi:spore maturation protein CgeB
MKVLLFCQSIVSCWNNGHAHFLRGVTRELLRLGVKVVVYEPKDGWSRMNAVKDGGAAVLAEAAKLVSGATVHTYDVNRIDLDRATDGADLVVVQEWNAPALIAAIGQHRVAGARYVLLFHDSHHRSVTAPDEIDCTDLDGYDGVLAFGEAVRQIYLKHGWTRRAFTWHEAADTTLFRPPPYPPPQAGEDRSNYPPPLAVEGREGAAPQDTDLIWIGNWGDDERSRELSTYLIEPAAVLGLRTRIYGVRYPDQVRRMLADRGIAYAGWLPNHRAPEAYSRARATVHIPRRPYCEALRGIPTIRVFEAMACGIPLISSPWHDEERLFPEGAYLDVATRSEMSDALSRVLRDKDLAKDLVATGLQTIRARHTCAHRVRGLLSIVEELGGRTMANAPSDAASAMQPVPQ